MRLRRGRAGLTGLVMAAAMMTTGTGCGALLLEDKGPLPPRYSGPPLPADDMVSELTSALEAEGITLERTPQELIAVECQEHLRGEHKAATADAALQAGFARARSEHGWKSEPGRGQDGWLLIRKGNWSAAAQLPGVEASDRAGSPAAAVPVLVLLSCDGALSKARSRSGSPTPSPTSSR
ncbi:hypothetical protein [Streptomyces xantholiticus]|uniref:hypothetical protein n=1 Tax=Streptomyces xantholiticus TaxID=68285 RepID=UPI001673EE71|nr:hypothetical protein [Streptomyces xantholiticus]GGW25534.1 hypothetical protein GCM10010381_06550 [Streptomyces xantholiticus]